MYNSLMYKKFLSPKIIGYGLVVISALGFGSYGVWSRHISEMGVFTQGYVRGLIVLALMLAIGIATGSYKKIERSDYKSFALPVLFGVFSVAPIYYAFNAISIGLATLVFFGFYLLASYAYGIFLGGERLTAVKITSAVLAAVGLLLTVLGGDLSNFGLIGMALAALNGVASGGEVATTKGIKGYSSLQISTAVWAGIVVTHALAAFIVGEAAYTPVLDMNFFYLVAYSIVALVSFWAAIEGYKYIDASVGGLVGLTEVIFALIFGVLFFAEKLTLGVTVGALILLLAASMGDILALAGKTRGKTDE
jgi:drug/metabolite transporter (DMT)-like permease